MIGAFIFIFILLTVLYDAAGKAENDVGFLFGVSLSCVTLLFLHHATDELGLSF